MIGGDAYAIYDPLYPFLNQINNLTYLHLVTI